MKPEDLKSPFSFDERQILIKDHVWYVPEYYDKYQNFSFPGFSDEQVFGNDQPVFLEYCSGNGSWIAAKAESNKNINYVACELKFGRVRKIWSKIKNLKLNNLFAICGEGFIVTSQYLKDESVDGIYINFPDPWPKKRHAKHRIIQQPFLNQLARILKPSGTITFVTDDIAYSDWTIEMFMQNENFSSVYEAPFYSNEFSGYGTSFFDQLWREKGRLIRYHQFRKKSLS